MSFDLFFARFTHGAAQTFPYTAIREAFVGCDIERHPTWVTLRFPEGEHCDVYVDDSPLIDTLMASRPPASRSFWLGLLSLMRLTHGTVYWGGGSVVADPAVIPHLPVDFVGPTIVVETPEDIIEAIHRS